MSLHNNINNFRITKSMFGIYRYILAVMVAIAHIAPMYMVHVGFYAVFAFFMLSGYLMSVVLNDTYYNLPKGIEKYTINRLLRILPAYWFVLLFSSIAAFYFPTISKAIHERMILPPSIGYWLANISVLGITVIDGRRIENILVPPAWSLSVEIIFWILMAFLINSRIRLALWGIMAISYTIFISLFVKNAPIQISYYSHLAGALPFFAGAFLYKLRKNKPDIPAIYGFISIIISSSYCILSPWIFNDPIYFSEKWYNSQVVHFGLYVATFINFITIYLLSGINMSNISKRIVLIDMWLGRLAYPIFLLHILTAIIFVSIFDSGCTMGICGRSWKLTLYSFVPLNILAIILWFIAEKPIAVIRERIKRKC